jgi:hypothetical protein
MNSYAKSAVLALSTIAFSAFVSAHRVSASSVDTYSPELFNTGPQVFALGALRIASDPEFNEFAKTYGNKSAFVMAKRISLERNNINADSEVAYNITFTKAELSALSRFYKTKEGRSIVQK